MNKIKSVWIAILILCFPLLSWGAFPSTLTNAVDGETEILAGHVNNLEAKVGVNNSPITTSLDYMLRHGSSIDPGHKHTPAYGGTGIYTYAVGDLLYASSASAFTRLADVATGNALISGGVTTAPAWGKIGLTTHVSGILGSANGGTGNGFAKFSGPVTAEKTFTLPDSNATLLYSGGALGTPASGTLTSCTFPTLNQDTSGTAAHGTTWGPYASISGPSQARTYAFPDSAATLLYDGKASGTFGTASSATGSVVLNNLSNANAFTIQPGATGAALSWTLPIAAPGGNNYLVNAQTTGALGYTDPATFALVGQTMNIGTTAVAINRGSAALALTGITSIDGNAATVTNGVYTNGSYADPSWLTSINATKLSTGTGAVGITAGGTAQNVTITPSTTGFTEILSPTTGTSDVFNSPFTLKLTGSATNATTYAGILFATPGANGNYSKASISGVSVGDYRGFLEYTAAGDSDTSGHVFKNYVVGDAVHTRMIIKHSGAVQMLAYGAGAATFDASGNITSVSDERLKNIQGEYTAGLKELMGIQPINYKWNKKSGMETEHTYAGFSAQNIQKVMPEAVYENKEGTLSFNDRAVLAAAVNAIKELNAKVIGLEAKVKKLEAKVGK